MRNVLRRGTRMASLMAVVGMLVFMTGIATAKTTSADSEKKLNTNIAMLDKDATLPHGEQAVLDRLGKTFNLSSDKITALKDKNLGYGEIATVLAMADKMSGGLTDENINKVVGMRQDHKGWGEIARSVDVKLGSIVSRVDSIEKDAHKDVKKASTEKAASGKGAGGGKDDAGKDKDKGYK